MSNAALVEAVRAASPEDRRSLLAELVRLTLADSPSQVLIKDANGGAVGWFVPNRAPPSITQADIDELDRRIARRHTAVDVREVIAEHRRRAAS